MKLTHRQALDLSLKTLSQVLDSTRHYTAIVQLCDALGDLYHCKNHLNGNNFYGDSPELLIEIDEEKICQK